jgi:RNA polymerase sigma-70 factor (ECF subfamily)
MDTERTEENGRSDLDEWRAYGKGDAGALARLVEKYRRPLFGFLSRFTGDAGQAEEWFQETWARALARPGSFTKPPLAPWLFRIAHNLAMDHFRRRRREGALPGAGTGDGGEREDGGEGVPDAAAVSPDRVVATRELGERIGAAVAALPEAQRMTFSLRMDGRLAFREIAEIQGCPLGTVLARMQYALAKLRAALAEDYEEWKEIR